MNQNVDHSLPFTGAGPLQRCQSLKWKNKQEGHKTDRRGPRQVCSLLGQHCQGIHCSILKPGCHLGPVLAFVAGLCPLCSPHRRVVLRAPRALLGAASLILQPCKSPAAPAGESSAPRAGQGRRGIPQVRFGLGTWGSSVGQAATGRSRRVHLSACCCLRGGRLGGPSQPEPCPASCRVLPEETKRLLNLEKPHFM